MSQYRTQEQAKAVDNIKDMYSVICEDHYYKDNIYTVDLLTYSPLLHEDYYLKFRIKEDGSVQRIEYEPKYITEEKNGDESFDVVVEREMKKEEKKVEDLRNKYAELIDEYIGRHSRELKDYADECKLSAFVSYAEDSLQDVIETVISNYYDNYDFDDVTFDDEDIEQMLIDNDILV